MVVRDKCILLKARQQINGSIQTDLCCIENRYIIGGLEKMGAEIAIGEFDNFDKLTAVLKDVKTDY